MERKTTVPTSNYSIKRIWYKGYEIVYLYVKTVWKIKSNNNLFCLKDKHTYDKALFSVNAKNYIKNSGGNVLNNKR